MGVGGTSTSKSWMVTTSTGAEAMCATAWAETQRLQVPWSSMACAWECVAESVPLSSTSAMPSTLSRVCQRLGEVDLERRVCTES